MLLLITIVVCEILHKLFTNVFDSILYAEVDSSTEERRPELYVECALYIDGALFGLPMSTRFYLFIYALV